MEQTSQSSQKPIATFYYDMMPIKSLLLYSKDDIHNMLYLYIYAASADAIQMLKPNFVPVYIEFFGSHTSMHLLNISNISIYIRHITQDNLSNEAALNMFTSVIGVNYFEIIFLLHSRHIEIEGKFAEILLIAFEVLSIPIKT
uniref:Uncharacterized protein n=1 Tax=Glossina palpalis gambiensis TaxID=67801 RepID=A0A1B0B4I5_9MUSC